jgi:glucose/arabinose dehydrogenase
VPHRAVASLVLLLLLIVAAPATAAEHLTQIGTFEKPLEVVAPPGDAHRLMVVQQRGRIELLKDGDHVATPFLDITKDTVQTGYEPGLLSIAFAPDYATSRKFYVFYNTPLEDPKKNGDYIAIDEFTSADGDHADMASRRRVLTIPHLHFDTHNGGMMQFGPDGKLYASTGDGGASYDPGDNAQDLRSKLGKILRINVATGETQVRAYGFRNPFRWSFDRVTGDMIIGDVGENTTEEINYIRWSDPDQLNFGWRCREGYVATPNVPPCDPPNYRAPIIAHGHKSDGFCAIIGGYVVRDKTLPDLLGRYVYGDNCQSQLRSATLKLPRATDDAPIPGLAVPATTGFGVDSCDHLYVTSLHGEVYRIDGDAPPVPCSQGPADTKPPKITLDHPHARSVLRSRGLTFRVTCNEQCGFTATGVLHIGRQRLKLVPSNKLAAGGAHTTVRLVLGPALRGPLKSALRHGRHPRLDVAVDARDGAGNARTARLVVHVSG